VNETIDERIASSRQSGERLAVATLRDGPRAGARLLVGSAGQTFGDLGWPRLNQRVALYAEQLFDRGLAGSVSKRFDVPGADKVEVTIELIG